MSLVESPECVLDKNPWNIKRFLVGLPDFQINPWDPLRMVLYVGLYRVELPERVPSGTFYKRFYQEPKRFTGDKPRNPS